MRSVNVWHAVVGLVVSACAQATKPEPQAASPTHESTAGQASVVIQASETCSAMTFTASQPSPSCEIALSRALERGRECHSRVRLNGTNVDCNAPGGWRLSDPSTIQLTGAACDTWREDESAEVEVLLPCNPLP